MRDAARVFISAPIAALVEGLLREDTRIGDLRARGDFGLGTFNDVDGEMVLLDDVVYRLPPDGPATIVGDEVETPFAMVVRFQAEAEERFDSRIAAEAFEAALADVLPSRNLVYAVRIDGRFARVKARSVPKQANYRPLAEIAKVQTVFEFADVEGTMVGFWTPSFLESVHVPGFHLHFITADRSAGGHVLAAEPDGVLVRLQHAVEVDLGLPMTLDFLTMRRTRDVAADVASAER